MPSRILILDHKIDNSDQRSVDLDGSTEYLSNTTTNKLSIDDEWTIAGWIKLDTSQDFQRIFDIKGTSDSNRFELFYSTTGTKLVFRIWDSAGTLIRHLGYFNLISNDTWFHFTLAWKGSGSSPFYIDGVLRNQDEQPTSTTGNLTDTSRKVYVGSNSSGGENLNGRIHSLGIWDIQLQAAAVQDLYNNGQSFDWRELNGSYSASEIAALQHFWRIGLALDDIGKDYSTVTTTGIDIDTNSVGVTSADIVVDYPGL